MRTGRPAVPPHSRFVTKYVVDAASGCWLWTAGCSQDGYGRFASGRKLPNGKMASENAHRYSYEYHVGPIPEGLQIDHLCRVRRCVNPDHLEAVTARVNSLRSESPAAKFARSSTCAQGHPLDGENVYRHSAEPNRRFCRECRKRHSRNSIARKRALIGLGEAS